MDINEQITVKLHWKDITEMVVALKSYKDLYRDRVGEETLQRVQGVINKLGEELYSAPPQCEGNCKPHRGSVESSCV